MWHLSRYILSNVDKFQGCEHNNYFVISEKKHCKNILMITALSFYDFVLQGFAQNLGRFLMLFQCAGKSDPSALAKVVQGLAMVSIVVPKDSVILS